MDTGAFQIAASMSLPTHLYLSVHLCGAGIDPILNIKCYVSELANRKEMLMRIIAKMQCRDAMFRLSFRLLGAGW